MGKADDYLIIEMGGEPEYFVTHTKVEPAGGGNIRVWCYRLMHASELHLAYTVVIPAPLLAIMARKAIHAAIDSHNIEQWDFESAAH